MYLGYLHSSTKVPEGHCWQRLLTVSPKKQAYIFGGLNSTQLQAAHLMMDNGWDIEIKQGQVIPKNNNRVYRYAVSIILREPRNYLVYGIKGYTEKNKYGRWFWKTQLSEPEVLDVLRNVPHDHAYFFDLTYLERHILENVRKTSGKLVAPPKGS